MKIKVISIDGKQKDNFELSEKIFSEKPEKKVIQYILDWQMNHFKPRKAKTKQRGEIKGSTAKIYAQKGTGGARHSSRKAPIFVGGGVAHGPKGESKYKKRKLNKSEKKQSIASLITKKNITNDLIIFSDFKSEINKTKEMKSILDKFNLNSSLLILDKESKNKIHRSIRNIPNIKVADANNFNIFDILKYKKLIFTESSVKELEGKF